MPDQSPEPPEKSHIHTEGGAFIGRDQNTYHIRAEEAYNVHGLTKPYLGLRA